MYEIYTKEKKTFLGIKQQHISYSKYENYASDHGILKKDRRFFFTLNSRFPWLMGFFGHNSLDFDAPSLCRFTQSTFNTAMACLNTINSCSSENTWTKNLPRHRGVRQNESAVKTTHAHTIRSVCHSAIIYTPRKLRKLCYCSFFSAKYLSFMNPRRNEQSPDFKMRFGDSICHSFSGTQTHEDQRPEGLRSPGKN